MGIANRYLGEQAVDGNDGSQDATIPDGTTTIWLHAEGGAVYATVNDDGSANSGYYVPEDAVRLVGPFANITSLGVFAATGVTAHLVYAG